MYESSEEFIECHPQITADWASDICEDHGTTLGDFRAETDTSSVHIDSQALMNWLGY